MAKHPLNVLINSLVPEIEAFEQYLPEDVHIITCHSLHGPSICPKGQPLVVMNHRSTPQAFELALQIFASLESRIVQLSATEHDLVTADTQAVTHVAFLSMGTAWMTQGVFPVSFWSVPLVLEVEV